SAPRPSRQDGLQLAPTRTGAPASRPSAGFGTAFHPNSRCNCWPPGGSLHGSTCCPDPGVLPVADARPRCWLARSRTVFATPAERRTPDIGSLPPGSLRQPSAALSPAGLAALPNSALSAPWLAASARVSTRCPTPAAPARSGFPLPRSFPRCTPCAAGSGTFLLCPYRNFSRCCDKCVTG